MVKGTTTTTRSSVKEPPSKPNEGRITAACPRRNSGAIALPTKPDRRSNHGKPRGGQAAHPHLENVDTNVGALAPSRNTTTPCASPLKSQAAKACNSLPLSSSCVEQGPSSTGYGGFLSRTSSNVSSLATSSDEEATTTGASSVSGSDAENVCFSARRKERVTRRASLGPKVEAELEKTPTKACRPSGRTTPCPSPAGSLRSGVHRALALPQPSLKTAHSELQSHFELEENPSFWDDHNVQVVVRARPMNSKEAAKQDFSRCLRQEGAHAISWLGQPETRFTFDHVAGENISQEKLFKVVGLPIVENCMAGYNSCMFAYGQTGSGKTHTMLGDITELGDRPSDSRGMTPRIFEYLFSRIQKEERDRQLEQLRYVCKCSFLEIYNEQITDLLEPSSSNLQMREDSKKGVYVENLTEKVVTSVQDVISLLLKGAANRKVASTNMNRESSRSHSVFTCSVECKWETNSLSNMRFGRLNLVDLAGSERQKSSGAEGDRLKEAASINKSLSTLGLVMMILVDIANGKQRHVPYRDSKLTFLLQDSLGGNSKTAIIATISPSSCCSMETLSTLKFAQRAKYIKNNAVINEDASGEMLALRREIQQLKEEVSRLRCQTISSLRRECRRDSNDFFRLSMTGKDLFDAAEKERADDGAELKSVELLEKIKALEGVLAGALRREQVADTATKHLTAEIEKASKLVEEQEIEVRGCKNLLLLSANEVSTETPSDTGKQALWAEKLEIAERLDYNRVVTKLELENSRLAEQLHCYHTFFDAGEREMMTAEIRGLRDQVLELLDGKVAVERGSLSTTIAQGDSYRMELETCRNDLTTCLEASSQLQRQVNELQTLVTQLTENSAEKAREVDEMKGICDQKQIRMKELEIERVLHLEEITDLKTQLQVEQDEAKNDANFHARLEQDFQGSLQEVERLQAEIREFNEKYVNIAKLKEEEIKSLQLGWETSAAKLYQDLAEGERALIEVGQEMNEIMGEEWLLKCVQEKSTRWSLESGKSPGGVDIEQEYFKCRASSNTDDIFGEKRTSRRKRSFGFSPRVSVIAEKNLKLEASVAQLEEELEDHKKRLEHTQKELERVERKKVAIQEEMEAFAKKSVHASEEHVQKFHEKNEAAKEAILALEEANHKLDNEVKVISQKLALTHVVEEELREKVSSLHVELEDKVRRIEELDLQEKSNSESHVEELRVNAVRINDLEASLEEKCEALEEAKHKLDSEVNILSQKLASTLVVEEELRKKVSFLHVELESKNQRIEELDLQAESHDGKLTVSAMRITDLEAFLVEKCEALATLEASLASAVATCYAVRRERDEAREHLQAATVSSGTQIQELRESLDLKSTDLEALQKQLLSLATSLEQSQDELGELKIKEAGLLMELLGLKQKLSSNVDVTREAETRLHEKVSAMSELLRNTDLEKDRLAEELGTAQALVLEHQNAVSIAQQENETNVQTIRHLNESVERLQTELQRKEDLLYGLEFDISLLQEHAAEETDFKQELLKANSSIFALQAEVQTRCEELKQLGSAKQDVEEQFALKTEAMKQVEVELLKSEAHVALVINESQTLNSRVSQLQTKLSTLEAEIAEKAEALSLLEKELMVTRVTSTRMTMECSHKTAALVFLQGEVESLSAERDDLKAQCSTLAQKVESLEGSITHQVEVLHGELLVSMMTEFFWLELNSSMTTAERVRLNSRLEDVELQKAAIEDELQTVSKTQTTLHDEIQGLTHRIADCQASNKALNLELAEKITKIISLQDELSIASGSSTEKLKTMKTEIRALLKERDDLQTEVGERSTTISFLENELMVARASAESSSEAIGVLETKIGTLQALGAEARKIANSVSEENSALQAQIVGLQAELSHKTALVVQLETQLAAASSSSTAVREELTSFEAQSLELQTLKLVLETEVAGQRASISCKTQENDELREQIETWQQKCSSREGQLDTMKAQLAQQEEQLNSLEEQLDRAEAEALQFMVNSKPNHATEERDSLRSEVEGLKDFHCTKVTESKEQENNEEIQTLKEARDKALEQVQALHDELERAQSLTATHQTSVLEKDEEARKLEALVSTLQNQNSALEKQLEVMKLEVDKLRQARDGFEMELQGMKNRMAMIQAVQSTGSRDVKGLQAAQAANVDLQRRLEEKETEVSQLYKRMATLHKQNEAQASRLDDMASELAHAHQELDELHCQCHDKDAQLSKLKELNKEAEKLTQDVMRDLHNVKLDISNYASLVNQQQLELIYERTRHSDEVREKNDEISNLQTQLNQERQTWMLEMNHKQAEMVVARVLSEKMRLKNKTLSSEYKKLKADCSGKKKKLKLLEQQLKELTADTRRVSMESEADFDEVQQFQALLAQANDTMEKESEADFDEVEQFQALLAQANDAQRQ